jgi:2,4-dienoyl-CoA reductase-like NADH-dependent reductase (Old Yellow Enzyme family)
VITEGVHTDALHSQGYLNQPGLVTAAHVKGWSRVVQAVHGAGVPVIAQLMHAGALSQGNAYGHGTIAPSAVPPRGVMLEEYGGSGPWPEPREATDADLEAVVAGFLSAARNARASGFDGVEVHAANGYLLDQFLTDYTNQRQDRYGGEVEARVAFAAEVAAALVGDAPEGFCVGVRLSQTKVNDFTHRWRGGADDATVIFERLARAGVDYVHLPGR